MVLFRARALLSWPPPDGCRTYRASPASLAARSSFLLLRHGTDDAVLSARRIRKGIAPRASRHRAESRFHLDVQGLPGNAGSAWTISRGQKGHGAAARARNRVQCPECPREVADDDPHRSAALRRRPPAGL